MSATLPSAREEVIVYRLLDPETIVNAAREIENAIVAACPIRPTSPEFAMSVQGCVRFVDRAARRQRVVPALLPQTDRAAATVARDFLKRAGAGVREATGGRVNDLFQLSVLEHAVTKRIHSRSTGEMDHWLSTWMLRLPSRPSGRHELAMVFGGTLTVRIGQQGRIIALVSPIRPIVDRVIRPAFGTPDDAGHTDQHADDAGTDDHRHEHEHDREHEEGEDDHSHPDPAPHSHGKGDAPIIVYVLEGPDSPQRFLAPCYVDPTALEDPEKTPSAGRHEHGHSNLWPACDHTLLPQLVVEQGEQGARVQAVLQGDRGAVVTPATSREFRMLWSVATQDELIEGEHFEDDAAVLELPAPGIYHVELTLEHLPSEATVTTYDYIPVPGKQELPGSKDRGGQRRVS